MSAAWAKRDDDGNALPLAEHGADVAAVLMHLLAEPHWAARIATCAGRPLSAQDHARLAVLAQLHDLGKANRGFWQRQFPGMPIIGHTNETAALFYAPGLQRHPTSERLVAILEQWECPDLFAATMAHHGRPLEAYADEMGRAARRDLAVERHPAAWWHPTETYHPMDQLAGLIDEAERRFPAAFKPGPGLPGTAPFVSMVCGLMTLADWLGSDTALFPVRGPYGPARDTTRRDAAARAVGQRGLGALPLPPRDFRTAFGLPAPRGIQHVADRLDIGPVVLFEAETGAGKTEAALWRWLALREAGQVDGLYFALPTRSAAVQLHARVQRMLDRVFGPAAVEAVLAVPGYLRSGDAEGQALPEFAVQWSDAGQGDARWAAERPKRFLAARVAVGTIDQVLMAGLRLRHAHLRAAVLARSLLVVDEVHASDDFMTQVLVQVLANHRAAGGHALLLSAILTDAVRAKLLGRPAAAGLLEAVAVPYPAISATGLAPASPPSGGMSRKSVALAVAPWIDGAGSVAERAIAAARAGASVLVVRNSVAGAVAVARAVAQAAPDLAFRVADQATVHHGRFAPGDRRLLDRAVEAAFGKDRTARGRILCGTQTLEQSLDLDADLLITDLAPMDVLLQRIGRLHRHPGRDRGAFGQAQAIVLVPAERDLSRYLGRVRERHGLGPIKDGQGVYPDLLVLEATLRLVEANAIVSIPADNRRLVEAALHPDALSALEQELGTAWTNHARQGEGVAYAERQLAKGWQLDLSQPFGTLLFPADSGTIGTRLGLRDRVVDFEPPFTGPFGEPVGRLTIPSWLAGDAALEATPVVVEQTADGTMFRLGERVFRYDRWGLDKDRG